MSLAFVKSSIFFFISWCLLPYLIIKKNKKNKRIIHIFHNSNNKEACLFKCQKIYSNKKCISLTIKTFLVYFILSKSEGIMAFANGLIWVQTPFLNSPFLFCIVGAKLSFGFRFLFIDLCHDWIDNIKEVIIMK